MPDGAAERALTELTEDWKGRRVYVLATGPSLTRKQCEHVRFAQQLGCKAITVNDAYSWLHSADIVYACDAKWWNHHSIAITQACPKAFHLTACPGGSFPAWVHRIPGQGGGDAFCNLRWRPVYGGSSGFQAVQIALMSGASEIVLLGFDTRIVADKPRHFFGEHPGGFGRIGESQFNKLRLRFFSAAEKNPEAAARIKNATPGSALTCFQQIELDAL